MSATRSQGGLRPVLLDVALVLGLFLLAGLAAGLLWPQLVEPVTVTRTDAGTVVGEGDLGRRFDNDGWYTVLAAGFGLLLGVVLTVWRRRDPVVTVLLLAAGGLAAAWVSSALGTWVGPEDPAEVLAEATPGATAPGQVAVAADAAYLVWPIAAVTGALVVLWSPPRRR